MHDDDDEEKKETAWTELDFDLPMMKLCTHRRSILGWLIDHLYGLDLQFRALESGPDRSSDPLVIVLRDPTIEFN